MSSDRPVTYAIGSTLGGPGIGTIAGRAVEGIARNGLLDRAYGWDTANINVPNNHISTVPLGGYIDRVLHHYRNDLPFDLLTEHWVDFADIFHGWNNMCLRTLRAANEAGVITVVERASAHPVVQRRIVEREFQKHGIEKQFIDDRTFARAIAELNEADAIAVPSDFVYESFIDQGFSPDQLMKTPFGVDVDRFDPVRTTGSSFSAAFVGHITIRKGIQYLLPAWEQADLNGTLRLAGEVRGVASDIIEPYRNDTTVEFLGFVDEIETVFQNADAFVFPTVEDGFGLVILEAMATGTPVITTSNAGASELINDGENGFVVEVGDIDSISDHLEMLAASPDRCKEMGIRARETAERYTWERYGDALTHSYLNLLDRNRKEQLG